MFAKAPKKKFLALPNNNFIKIC